MRTSDTPNFDHTGKKVSPYYEKMSLLKKTIEEHVQSNLPTIPELAQQLNMTASTLKRQFKLHLGINIYHYYLQKKMEVALKLLHEEQFTVNETAERLGYASVSNFIETFKKYYGDSPGNYKRLLLTKTVKTSESPDNLS